MESFQIQACCCHSWWSRSDPHASRKQSPIFRSCFRHNSFPCFRCSWSCKCPILIYHLHSSKSLLYLQEGLVYAVEFSHRSGRDLINVAKKRTNIIPIIEDARHPHKYRMLVSFSQLVFVSVASTYVLFRSEWLIPFSLMLPSLIRPVLSLSTRNTF